jgi:hypothetical protein
MLKASILEVKESSVEAFCMKTMERWLLKAVLIQLVLLLAVQITLHLTKGELFLSKVVQYEGVNNMSIEDWIETFKQKD